MPAPANDNFASAEVISGDSGSTAGTTLDATFEAGETGGSFFDWDSVWYEFTPTNSGWYRIGVASSSITYVGVATDVWGRLDLKLGQWTDAADFNGGATTIATAVAGHPTSGNPSQDGYMIAFLTAGQTYQVFAGSPESFGTPNYDVVDFTLTWDLVPTPSNDDFANAEVISGESGSTTADTTAASTEASEPTPFYWSGGPYNSVWFEWTAPTTGRYRFEAGDADHDTYLAAYTGSSLGSLTPISKSDDGTHTGSVFKSVIGIEATAGTTYKIQVDARSRSSSTLSWSKLSSSDGDSQGTAIELDGRVETTVDNLGFDGAPPADVETRFNAFTGYVGSDVYHFGRPIWYHVTADSFARDIKISADATAGGSHYAELAIFVYDGTLTPRNTTDGFDAVAISDYDDGLRVPTSATNFGSASATSQLKVHVPAGEEAYIVMVGFVVEGYASPDPSVITDADFTEWEVPMVLISVTCIPAASNLNPDSTTASVVDTDYVRESDPRLFHGYGATESSSIPALKWTWTGPSGVFEVSFTGKKSSGVTTSGQVRIVVKRNGYPFTSVGRSGNHNTADTDDFDVDQYFWLNHVYDSYDFQHDVSQFPYVILDTGDTVEVVVVSSIEDSGTQVPFDIKEVCFTKLSGIDTSTCTGVFDFPENPLGDQWGSEKQWGGQKLIPDQIWTETSIIPYDESNYAWGVNFTDNDMTVLADGTVYVIIKDGAPNSGIGTGGINSKQYVVLKKYDPGVDDWTQVATLNIHNPDDKYEAGATSIALGPDGFIYASWWEVTTYTAGTPALYQADWHLIKLDPSDDSYVELGTGQHVTDVAVGQVTQNTDIGDGTWANEIVVMPDGKVFVATTEYVWVTADVATPGAQRRSTVWLWDGSSWTNLVLPDPTVITGTYPGAWYSGFENQFWDKLVSMIAARPTEGPVTDGVTVYYPYHYTDVIGKWRSVTITYTIGSGWGTAINTDWDTLLGDVWHFYGDGPPSSPWPYDSTLNTLDETLLWSETMGRLVLATDTFDPWAVFQMNDAGDAWEIAPAISNGKVAMQWDQSRNAGFIGPDGMIYRAMMGDVADGNWWYPKITKYDPDFGPGYANAARHGCGEVAQWATYMYATQNVKPVMVGNDLYVLLNLQTEPWTWESGVDEREGDGFFVFKCSFIPCAAAFTPHIYRRVLG